MKSREENKLKDFQISEIFIKIKKIFKEKNLSENLIDKYFPFELNFSADIFQKTKNLCNLIKLWCKASLGSNN